MPNDNPIMVNANNAYGAIENERKLSFDIFRLIAAFAVVCLHTSYAHLYNPLVLFIRMSSKFAVPYFFMISGFYFYSKIKKNRTIYYFNTIKKLVQIYIVGNLFSIPFLILENHKPISEIFSSFSLTYSESGHLWFISSMIMGFTILLIFITEHKSRFLQYLSILIILFNLVSDAYSPFLPIHIEKQFTTYVLSIPYIFCGYLFAKNFHKLNTIPLYWGYIIAVAGLALELTEVITIYQKTGYSPHNQSNTIGTFFFALGCFVIAYKSTWNNKLLAELGGKFSLAIFIYHPFVYMLLKHIFYILPPFLEEHLFWISPILTFSITLALLMFFKKYFGQLFSILNGELFTKKTIQYTNVPENKRIVLTEKEINN